MTHIAPYIGFNGKAEEALTFYQNIFGGELDITLVKDAPMAVQMPDDQVFHAALKIDGKIFLMGTDMTMGEFQRGNSISVAIMPESETDARAYFDGLKDGGQVAVDLAASEWGSLYGQVVDKYGVNWMIDCAIKDN